ncbi:MAG: hypothetical protein M3391_02665 [Actinomycetota bacterium]|nr:hypothetical protein [Actinomycetota bacterium]
MNRAKGRPQAHRDRIAVVFFALALLHLLPVSKAETAADLVSTIAGTATSTEAS